MAREGHWIWVYDNLNMHQRVRHQHAGEYVPVTFFKMRDEKEERKKQARSNKQTRQSNTAHVRAYI